MRDTIDMAREAGLHIATDVNWMPIIGLDHLKAFEALVRADEREACAKVCDHMASRCNDIRAAALESAAENIRARGQALCTHEWVDDTKLKPQWRCAKCGAEYKKEQA